MSGSLLAEELLGQLRRVLLGKDEAIRVAMTALFAGGHLLIEDAPGVGKTMLSRALAKCTGLDFGRIQCTADLLPSDIVGAEFWNPATQELSVRRGPVFAQVLLADELNRMPPRTQSALLECMSEGSVSIGRESLELEAPFFVIATQNPASSAGTYPLPSNQLDRFMIRMEIGYPLPQDEVEAVRREDGHRSLDSVEVVADAERIRAAQHEVTQVRLTDELVQWIVDFANATRIDPDFELGLSTRGAQALHRCARAYALVRGRDYVVPDDLDRVLPLVCAHRVRCRVPGRDPRARLEELRSENPPTRL